MLLNYFVFIINAVNWDAIGAIGEWAGAIGAIIAVRIAYLALKKDTVPNPVVTFKQLFWVLGTGVGGYSCEIVNNGPIPIKIKSAHLEVLPSKMHIYIPFSTDRQYNITLNHSDGTSFQIPRDELLEWMRLRQLTVQQKVRLIFTDTVGRSYSSTEVEILQMVDFEHGEGQ